jgi:4-hydroxybenzoate polyprenyltransferase
MGFYRNLHFLSLDIVAGALATSCLAARLFRAGPGWAWWVTLAFTVWLLYMGDHLLDAWKHRKQSHSERHLFIIRNRRILLWLMGITGVADLIMIFNLLDRAMLKIALVLGGLVLLFYAMRHLIRRNRLLFVPGEVFVLILYLAGTWLGPFVARTEPLLPEHGMVALMMGLVLLMNLGIISLYDVQLDSRLGISSLAHALGNRITRNLMVAMAAGVLLLAVLQFMVYGADRYTHFALVLSGMVMVLLVVLLFPSLFRKNEAYRLVSDAVLCMGFLSLLIHT